MAAAVFPSLQFSPLQSPPFPVPSPRYRRKKTKKKSRRGFVCSASFRNGRPPETECPVPLDQQPVNEFQALSSSFPFSWAAGDLRTYCSRLAFTGAAFALLLGLPVSAFGKGFIGDPETYALRCTLGAVSTGLLAVILAVLRMYLGWAYVGNRLLSATVEYEETGWYDGQIWVKTPEVLARDRLLGSFSVKPVLGRVKATLVLLSVSLATSIALFVNVNSTRVVLPDEGGRVIVGVYSDDAARSFEPEAFCGGESISPS